MISTRNLRHVDKNEDHEKMRISEKNSIFSFALEVVLCRCWLMVCALSEASVASLAMRLSRKKKKQ